jgi:hypothetical protein
MDAYFMRVDKRVTQVPPLRTREHENQEATNLVQWVIYAIALEENNHRIPTV